MKDLYFALLEFAYINNLSYSQILEILKKENLDKELSLIQQNFSRD